MVNGKAYFINNTVMSFEHQAQRNKNSIFQTDFYTFCALFAIAQMQHDLNSEIQCYLKRVSMQKKIVWTFAKSENSMVALNDTHGAGASERAREWNARQKERNRRFMWDWALHEWWRNCMKIGAFEEREKSACVACKNLSHRHCYAKEWGSNESKQRPLHWRQVTRLRCILPWKPKTNKQTNVYILWHFHWLKATICDWQNICFQLRN